MDTISVPEAARMLGTTAPRIWRAVDRLGIQPSKGPLGHLVDQDQLGQIKAFLGYVPKVSGLDRESLLALAALSRRPFGVRSARVLAESAGISPTTSSRVLKELTREGLVERTEPILAEGSARKTVVYALNRDNPRWSEIAQTVTGVELPIRIAKNPKSPARRIPSRLRHHFWNASPEHLKLPEHADYVAARLLRTNDPEAVAWAALNLPADSIRKVAELRGLSERDRGWLRNVASTR